jgi:16S rRNA (cytosine967-C5)-methyltransferase
MSPKRPPPGPGPKVHRPKPPVHPAPPRRDDRPLREDLVIQASLEAYGSVRHENRLADRALDFTLRTKRHLYSSERRAVAERVYSLLRQQLLVDFALGKARRRFDQLARSEQDALRLAASRVLDGEAPEDVARLLSLSTEDTAGLRAFPDAVKEVEKLPPEERFSIRYSLPPLVARRMMKELGAEADAAAAAMNVRAPLAVRANSLKTDRLALKQALLGEGVDARETELSPLGLVLDTRVNAFSLPPFRDGLFEIQDEGSQLLGMLVDAPPTRAVDACAGAGGKTLQLAAQMKNRGELHALDIDERRLDEMRKRARRAGVHNVRTKAIAAAGEEACASISELVGKADRVLVDAPCSGTGTYRRKPDARYRLTEDQLAEHVARQKELLERFCTLVKPGGRLIYGTCSILRDENEAVIDDFLSRHADFSVVPPADRLGEELGAKVSRNGFLRLFPHRHGTDGFFGAILLRAK